MCRCVILLELLSQLFCCVIFKVSAIILVAGMAIPTVMARLVGFVSRIVARMVAHRYVQHQCVYVLFYSNRSHGCVVVLFSMLQPGFWWQ